MKKLLTILTVISCVAGVAGFIYSLSTDGVLTLIVSLVLLVIICAASLVSYFERKKGITLHNYLKWTRGKWHDGYKIIKREAIYTVESVTQAKYKNTIYGKSTCDCLEETEFRFSWDQSSKFKFVNDERGAISSLDREGTACIAKYRFKNVVGKNECFQSTLEISNLETTPDNFSNHSFLETHINHKKTKLIVLKCLIKKDLSPINARFAIKNNDGKIIYSEVIASENNPNDEYVCFKKMIKYPNPSFSYIIDWDCLLDK